MKSPFRNSGAMAALVALLIGAVMAYGQTPLGRLSGTVRDQTGAVVPNATVTVTNELTGQPVQTLTTNEEGVFIVPQLAVGSYAVKIEAPGFKTGSFTEVKIDPGQEYSLVAQLEVGAASEVVQVTAGTDLVNTSTPEISNTIIRRQIVDLPIDGRNPIALIRLQAGVVGLPTRANTTINGGRPTWTQLTQDGINIQDNFIRVNSLDFVPNRPTSDTIGEFSITTNTQGADAAGGSSQVKLITPSGSSEFHGSLYEFNRNSALAANTWFNNATVDPRTGKTIPKPFLNRNQFGGNISGPIWMPEKVFGPLAFNENREQLFFFFSYEAFRQRQQRSQNNTIPARDDYLNGVFRYVRPSDNSIQQINVIDILPGVTRDPRVISDILSRVPSASIANNFDVGNSTSARILNTAGYRFNQSDANDRNQYAMRFDYQASSNHRFEFIHQRMRETDDRTDLDTVNLRPRIFTVSPVKLWVGAWRWTATSKLQNELRIGANLAPVRFDSIENYSGLIWGGLPFTNREVTFLPQGRDTRTRQYIDNASYVTGNHGFQFGGSLQQIRVRPYNFAGIYPTVNFGFSAGAPAAVQLTAAHFPGGSIAAADLNAANALRAFLGGIISSEAQTFQVRDKTSGYVAGIPNERNFIFDNWSTYIQDNWKVRPNLSLRLGLKWEYFSPLRERDDLQLLPVVSNDDSVGALLNPNGRIDFTNGGFYKKDLNNFGPSIGFAWDPFKDGKTSIRAGYTMAFVNEETLTVARNASIGNDGLSSSVTVPNLYTPLAAGVPAIIPPAFRVPRNYADQFQFGLAPAAFTLEQNIKQPYVHQVSVSVEREIGLDIAVEGRYVATLGRGIWRGVDYNQVNAAINQPFFQDFNRARQNGFIALNTPNTTPGCTTATCGVFNPNYNANLPGSQQLTILPNFNVTAGGNLLNNNTIRTQIQQGQIGSLADSYLSGVNAATATLARNTFFSSGNPGIYAADLIINGGRTDYHAFQGEVRRRFSNGIFGQMNYTFSKVLTNSAGTTQARFEPFIDNDRKELERVRADFDVTHVINASLIFELPFGRSKRWLNSGGVLEQIVGGWQVSSIVHYQSGSPISILSGRGTFNRGGRSGGNPANSSLTRDEIKDLFGIQKLPDGRVFYIDPRVTYTDGRAVGPDQLNLGAPAFAGQVFFNPSAGEIGSLQRLQFDGPSQTSWDFGLIKRFNISETKNFELRGDFLNFLNHPLFFVGDYNVNSVTFGRITTLNFDPRVIQVAAKFNF